MSSDLNGSQAQSEHNGHEIIKNINLILGNSLNLSALNLESKTFKENEAQESSEDSRKTKDKRKENSYLQALLGLNNNSEKASGIHTGEGVMSEELRISPAIETNSTVVSVNENGKNNPDRTRKESCPLSGNDHSQRLKSMNFNWPIGDNGGMRPRSVSFCDAQLGYKESCSPNYSRPHSSEAGSPTLEQVLLMGRSPESYRSYSSESYCNSFEDFSRSINGDGANYKSEPRPTLASLHEIDVAVAQAVQNLQTLQEKRASVYANLGGLSGSTSRDVPSPRQQNSGDLNNNNNNNNININNNNNSSDRNNNFSSPPPTASLRSCRRPVHTESKPWHRYNEPMSLEKAARAYRSAATVYDANYTWSGQLPPRARGAGRNPTYSSKIFLGGVPWDITEHSLVMAFADFGQVRVEWPGRDANSPPRGYLYLVFEDEESVRDLLTHCTYDYSNGGSYYYKISSRRMRSKEVQIIPWVITDSNFVRCPSPRLDSQMTVFVGALHGMINAEGLAIIFNDLFDGVIYAGLDTDKHKYPIGSGRVTFSNATSYMKAVAAAFIEVKTPRFCKKIQVDPYVEDSLCSTCGSKQGPYFCRDLSCFKYFCKSCWEIFHTAGRSQHIPMMRIIRSFPARRHDNFRSTDYRNGQGQMGYGSVKNDSAAASDLPRAHENNQGKSQEMEISQRLGDLSLDVFLRNVLGKTPVDEESNTLVETTSKETKK